MERVDGSSSSATISRFTKIVFCNPMKWNPTEEGGWPECLVVKIRRPFLNGKQTAIDDKRLLEYKPISLSNFENGKEVTLMGQKTMCRKASGTTDGSNYRSWGRRRRGGKKLTDKEASNHSTNISFLYITIKSCTFSHGMFFLRSLKKSCIRVTYNTKRISNQTISTSQVVQHKIKLPIN